MMRRNFTGPVWGTIAVGIIYILWIGTIFSALRMQTGAVFRMRSWIFLIPVAMVVLIVSEAVIYWRLRKINVYRKESWMHVGFLAVGIIGGPFLRVLFLRISRAYYGNGVDYRIPMNNFSMIFAILYWALIVVAHGYFVYVVRKCLMRRPAEERGSGEENLLDDILQ